MKWRDSDKADLENMVTFQQNQEKPRLGKRKSKDEVNETDDAGPHIPNVNPVFEPLSERQFMKFIANDYEQQRRQGMINKHRLAEPSSGGVLNGEWSDKYERLPRKDRPRKRSNNRDKS